MKKYISFGFFLAFFLALSTVPANAVVVNGWESISGAPASEERCALQTVGLPFTFSLYKMEGVEGVVYLLRLTNQSWGMGMEATPQIRLEIGTYQKGFIFRSHHLTTLETRMPYAEMVKIIDAMTEAQSGSFTMEGLEPNYFSLKTAGSSLSSFKTCLGA